MSQLTRATEQRDKSERRLSKPLREWFNDVVSGWKVGVNQVSVEDKEALSRLILRNQEMTAKSYIGDIREFKQENDDIYDILLASIASGYYESLRARNPDAINGMIKTVEKNMSSSMGLSETNREARRILANYSRNHAGTIIVTESTFAVENLRLQSVKRINDPLKNTVRQVVELLKAGDTAGAKAIVKQFDKLRKLPSSKKQGTLINYINDNREALITPFSQGRILATLEKRAEELGVNMKRWVASPPRVRASHEAANGQEVEIDQPFRLAGGLLMMPSDGSLGAGLEEIINCKCLVEYI